LIRFYIALVVLAFMITMMGIWAEAASYWVKPSFFVETLILLVFSTGLLYRYLFNVSSDLFVQLYLSTIAIKILAYAGYMFLVVSLDSPGAPRNVAFFMFTYLVFTAVEIGFLYHKKTRS
jgi:hypothetical protein